NKHGIPTSVVRKLDEEAPNIGTLISSGKVKLLVNTATRGRQPERDGFRLRRRCIEIGIPTITSLDTLLAVTDCLLDNMSPKDVTPCELKSFEKIVFATKDNILPLKEMPGYNPMLKK
ncbi:MAG: hypothetical protein ACYC5K_13715, partial [Saccharofermentanales bacterium]